MYETLKAKLKEMGKTRHWLARTSGIYSPDLYSALEGKKPLYPGWKKRIAEALNASEDELFPESED